MAYYNLFNLEGESNLGAVFVSYATLGDRFNDENRTGAFVVADTPHPVPLPATPWLVALGLGVAGAARARRVWTA